MQVTFVSKNILLTEGLKTFISSRLDRLQKYSSQNLSRIQIVLDVDRHRKGKNDDAVIEMVGEMKGRRIAVREHDETFYKAFFGAFSKMKTRILKERKK